MSRTTTTVATRPTMDSLTGGEPVLYDDGKCPPGQIAQFTKRGGRTQINRACVARPS